MHHHDHRHTVDADDRRDVAEKIEVEFLVERAVDGILRIHGPDRIAIGGRAHGRLGRNIAAGARPNLDDELLAEALGYPLRHQARRNVRRAAGGLSDDNAHGPRRVGLRPRKPRRRRQRNGASSQM